MEYQRTPDQALAPHGDPYPVFPIERAHTEEEREAIRERNLALLAARGTGVEINF